MIHSLTFVQVSFVSTDRMRAAVACIGATLASENTLIKDNKSLVKLSSAADPGFQSADGRPIIPGGFLAAYMIWSDYGINTKHTLLRLMAAAGIKIRHGLERPPQTGKTTRAAGAGRPGGRLTRRQIMLFRQRLCERITKDLPGFLVRQLVSQGARTGVLTTAFFSCMEHQGLHRRGLDILSAVLTTSSGADGLELYGNLFLIRLLSEYSRGVIPTDMSPRL